MNHEHKSGNLTGYNPNSGLREKQTTQSMKVYYKLIPEAWRM